MSLYRIGIIIVSLIGFSSHAFEYNLPFHKAQAWASFFVLELNEGIYKIGIDGSFEGTSYRLPIPEDCVIDYLNYRPVVPLGQLYLNYQYRCELGSGVSIVKIEKVGTTIKQLHHQKYGAARLGAGLWLDEIVVLTARGTIAILDKQSNETIYIRTNLDKTHKVQWFSHVKAWTKGLRFQYDTGNPREARRTLCLELPVQKLRPCQ